MKPFFYRINAADLLAYVVSIPPQKRGGAFLRFATLLVKQEKHVENYVDELIQEAEKFIQQKQQAGRLGAKQRHSSALAAPKRCHSTAIARSSNRKEKEINKEKEKHPYRDNVLLTSDEYQKLIDQYGQSHVEKMLDKLAGYKLSKGKTYKSDYGAILQWVAESTPAPLHQVMSAPTTPQPYC